MNATLSIGTQVQVTTGTKISGTGERETITGTVASTDQGANGTWYRVNYTDSKGRERFCWLTDTSTNYEVVG